MGAPTGMLMPVLLVALVWSGCVDEESAFQSPAQTYHVYVQAVEDDDPSRAWSCLSSGYRQLSYDNDLDRWRDGWSSDRPGRLEAIKRLQISQEQIISEQVAFLEFDESTVKPGESPFSYFIFEQNRWRMTSHLDPAFRQALETAVETGDYRLPPSR